MTRAAHIVFAALLLTAVSIQAAVPSRLCGQLRADRCWTANCHASWSGGATKHCKCCQLQGSNDFGPTPAKQPSTVPPAAIMLFPVTPSAPHILLRPTPPLVHYGGDSIFLRTLSLRL